MLKKFAVLLPVACAGLMFWLSSIPDPGLSFTFKMVAHILGYAVFTSLLIMGIKIGWPRSKFIEILIIAVFFAFLFALSDELHQYFVPGRGGCLRDIGFDVIGILIAAGLWSIFKKLTKN